MARIGAGRAVTHSERAEARQNRRHTMVSAGDVESVHELREMVASLESQLVSLYEDRERADAEAPAQYGHRAAIEMVHSLEAQVGALLEERDELALALAAR